MAWNFQCWEDMDWGPLEDAGSRCVHGGVNITGRKSGWVYNIPAGLRPDTNLWFVGQGTLLMSFLIHDTYTAADNIAQYLVSFGVGGDAKHSFRMFVRHQDPGDSKIHFEVWDRNTATDRYIATLGDEDGVSWLQTNKWYQLAVSISPTAIQTCINGEVGHTADVTTNTPGPLNWSNPIENTTGEWAGIPGFATNSASSSRLIFFKANYSTMVRGPVALDTTALDLSSAAVRARIWDANGDFIFPGRNGSLWFNDTYTEGGSPRLCWLDGSGRWDTGSDPGLWYQVEGGSSGSETHPGGTRVQYES